MRNPTRLLRQLNEICVMALEEATNLCCSRAHAEILPEHWLLKLMESTDSDLLFLLNRYEINCEILRNGLLKLVDSSHHPLHIKPVLSSRLVKWLESAWLIASLDYQEESVRSLHLIQALQRNPQLLGSKALWPLLTVSESQLDRILPELNIYSGESPVAKNQMIQQSSTVDDIGCRQIEVDDVGIPKILNAPSNLSAPLREALDRFTVNLTERAKAGKIDPVFGRESEVRQVEDILARRRKNNPILVGDPGVGKTALVEGLALNIAKGQVSEVLKQVEILALDMGLLQAGASVKGEFEQRLKNVISAIQQSPKKIILFIDEAHTLIGAGNQAGASDAANLLKPALARGELRTIAATTWSEFKQYFERDAALERRFQPVKVDEPDDDRACQMLRGLQSHYAKHHGVYIRDDALRSAVKLSRRYIPGRQLPDKAVDLLDTAAARVRMDFDLPPAQVRLLESRQVAIHAEIDALQEDSRFGYAIDHIRLTACVNQLKEIQQELEILQKNYQIERILADAVLEARKKVAGESSLENSDELEKNMLALALHQGKSPLLSLDVDPESIARVIADWTGVPAGSLLDDELTRLLSLEEVLQAQITGQDIPLAIIARHLRTAKAGLTPPEKPLGVFLLTGPSGVGKTETARLLATQLCGSLDALITINLSEYQEAHTVSQLKGSPPGYVGYGQGGLLTEAVRQRPYSVILLDETEKAHRDVLNLFYQVFDRGFMRDGEGREINFANTLIIMTSNLGSQEILEHCQNQPDVSHEALLDIVRPSLLEYFQPALLARLQPLVYRALNNEQVAVITDIKLRQLSERITQQFGCTLKWDETLVEKIAQAGAFHDSGARYIDEVLQQQIMPDIATNLLQWQREKTQRPQCVYLKSEELGISLDIE
jgi:type VI secretion system protein VasG